MHVETSDRLFSQRNKGDWQQMRVEYFDGFAETSAEGNQKFESKI